MCGISPKEAYLDAYVVAYSASLLVKHHEKDHHLENFGARRTMTSPFIVKLYIKCDFVISLEYLNTI